MVDVSIVVPTFNERENIKKLIPRVAANLEMYLKSTFRLDQKKQIFEKIQRDFIV